MGSHFKKTQTKQKEFHTSLPSIAQTICNDWYRYAPVWNLQEAVSHSQRPTHRSELKVHVFLKTGIKDAVCWSSWEIPVQNYILKTPYFSATDTIAESPCTHNWGNQDSHCLQSYRTRTPFFSSSSPLISGGVKRQWMPPGKIFLKQPYLIPCSDRK